MISKQAHTVSLDTKPTGGRNRTLAQADTAALILTHVHDPLETTQKKCRYGPEGKHHA